VDLSLNTDADRSDYFVNFTHVRDGENYHIYLRLEHIKSWEAIAMSGSADRATRWRLTTTQGDTYYTLNNFNDIMTTCKKYPRAGDGNNCGRVGDSYLYRRGE
jgi:hypothetical protein